MIYAGQNMSIFNFAKVSITVLFTFFVPLSVTICRGHPKRGKISSMIKLATVSAVLSGTANASGQPLYQSTKAIIYLFPDKVVGYGPQRSKLTLAIGYGGISVSCKGKPIFCKDLVLQTVHSGTY